MAAEARQLVALIDGKLGSSPSQQSCSGLARCQVKMFFVPLFTSGTSVLGVLTLFLFLIKRAWWGGKGNGFTWLKEQALNPNSSEVLKG